MITLSDFYKVNSSSDPVFAGGGLAAYLSNQSGTVQIHLVNINTGEEKQLTHLSERVTELFHDIAAGHTGNDNLFFSSDVGGNEKDQIYSVSVSTGEVKNLTNNPNVKFVFGAVLSGGEKILLSSNARNSAHYDICTMDIKSGIIEILVENNDNYNNPAALSPDGKYFLYNKLKSADSNSLWILDMAAMKTQRLHPEGGEAVYIKPCFVSDCSGFYLITDWNSNFTYAAYYDIEKGTLTKVYEKPWNIENISLSFDDKYLAVSVNEEGYSKLHIVNLHTNCEENIIPLPKCHMGGMVFSKSSYEMLFMVSSIKRPSDIWLLDFKNDILKRLTKTAFSNLPQGSALPELLVEPELRRYNSFDGLSVPYWLYKKPGSPKNAPLIIHIHGGPKAQEFPVYKPFLAYLVNEGFTVAAPNVRGSSGYGKKYFQLDDVEKRLDSVKDIKSLVDHLISDGLAVKGKIGVMGASYGGFMTLACITHFPELFTAAVDTVGIVNFETFLENTSDYRRPHRESEYGSLKEHRHVLRAISPIHKIADIKTPLMVIHGKNDPRVPVSEAEQVVKSLNMRGIAVEYLCYDDEGHGIKKRINQLDCFPRVAAFLKKHLI